MGSHQLEERWEQERDETERDRHQPRHVQPVQR